MTSRFPPRRPRTCRWPRSTQRRDVRFETARCSRRPDFQGQARHSGQEARRHVHPGRQALPFHLDRGPDPVAAAKESLAGFDSFVNQAITAWEVPGLAIAVVKNGEVILAQGFGMRDVDKKLPVTPKTLFAIGSCTKAFTTFVMGTLVDEGKLDWDTPVRTYHPRAPPERPRRHRADHPARPGDAPLGPAPPRPGLVQRHAVAARRSSTGCPTSSPPRRFAASSNITISCS